MSRRIADSRVRAYFAKLPARARSHMRAIRDAIRSAAPDGIDVISYRIPAVKLRGRILVYYAAWATHCSVYPPTVRFPLDRPVPAARIKRLVRARGAKLRSKARR